MLEPACRFLRRIHNIFATGPLEIIRVMDLHQVDGRRILSLTDSLRFALSAAADADYWGVIAT